MKLPLFGLGLGVGALLLLAAPGTARANGRYPAAGQIAVDPSKPTHIAVRTTYGLITTQDAKSWSWICDGAVGFGGYEDPMLAITKDGSLLAGIFEGLSTSRDGGCQWSFATGGLASRFVIDLATDRADPSSAVLLVSNNAGTDKFLTQMWQTADDGKTWAEIGTDVPVEVLGLTCETSPSDPKRLYVSGRVGGPSYTGVLERSDDRGKTWTQLPIPGSDDTNLPYIGAVDPKNPDTVYVRLNSAMNDKLVMTKDGGKTWSDVFTAKGSLLGFALSPDGGTVAIGGASDGLWTAPTGSMALAFTQVAKLQVKCLTWSDAGLYACADEFVDGFTAGLSTNQGKTFAPVMHLTSPCGPLSCPAGTITNTTCPPLWAATEQLIGGSCGHEDGAGGGGGGGTTGASSSSSGSSAGAGSTSGGVVDGTGSSCAFGSRSDAGAGISSLLAAAGAAFAFSRRGRGRRGGSGRSRRS